MWKQDTLTPGINDEQLSSGINDENEDLDDKYLDEDENEDLDDDSEDQDDDQDDDQDNKPPLDKNWDPISKSEKHRLYAITNLQNKKIRQLTKELSQVKNIKTLSDDDLAKIKEKYSEEDLDVIEKIIEKKTNELLNTRQKSSLEQRELNIFLKDHPELDDPEIKHIRSLQKEYWYSLKKAYNVLFGKFNQEQSKPKHNISNSFWWDNNNRSSKSNSSKDDEQAFKDMEAYLS